MRHSDGSLQFLLNIIKNMPGIQVAMKPNRYELTRIPHWIVFFNLFSSNSTSLIIPVVEAFKNPMFSVLLHFFLETLQVVEQPGFRDYALLEDFAS